MMRETAFANTLILCIGIALGYALRYAGEDARGPAQEPARYEALKGDLATCRESNVIKAQQLLHGAEALGTCGHGVRDLKAAVGSLETQLAAAKEKLDAKPKAAPGAKRVCPDYTGAWREKYNSCYDSLVEARKTIRAFPYCSCGK